jgi:hypothetical protein
VKRQSFIGNLQPPQFSGRVAMIFKKHGCNDRSRSFKKGWFWEIPVQCGTQLIQKSADKKKKKKSSAESPLTFLGMSSQLIKVSLGEFINLGCLREISVPVK